MLITRGGAVCSPNLATVSQHFNLSGPGPVSTRVVAGDESLNPRVTRVGFTNKFEMHGVVIVFRFNAKLTFLFEHPLGSNQPASIRGEHAITFNSLVGILRIPTCQFTYFAAEFTILNTLVFNLRHGLSWVRSPSPATYPLYHEMMILTRSYGNILRRASRSLILQRYRQSPSNNVRRTHTPSQISWVLPLPN